jgi:GR25 family glycosyltransferase involved in LPS biosynthesis
MTRLWHATIVLIFSAIGARAITPCEEALLRQTTMELHGANRDRTLAKLGVDAIYVTHYSPLKDRRARMGARLDKLGLQARFITGWDRETLTDEIVGCVYPSNTLFARVAREMNFKLSWLKVGEISLNMKHAAAYYHAATHGYRHIIVLEDDAFFSDHFTGDVAKLLAGVQPVRAVGPISLPVDYQLAFLCDYFPPTEREKAAPQRLHTIPHGERTMHGACGYMLSRAGIQHLLDTMPYKGPADLQIAHWEFPSAPPRRFTLEPWPAWPDKLGSQRTQKRDPSFARTADLEPCWGKSCPPAGSVRNVSEHIVIALPQAAGGVRWPRRA